MHTPIDLKALNLTAAIALHEQERFAESILIYDRLLVQAQEDPRLIYLSILARFDSIYNMVSFAMLEQAAEKINSAQDEQAYWRLRPYREWEPCALYAEALVLARNVIQLAPEHTESLLRSVFFASLQMLDFDLSHELNDVWLKTHPQDYDTHIRLACSYLFRNRDKAKAEALLWAALNMDESRPEAHLFLSIIFELRKQHDWANAAMLSVIDRLRKPCDSELWLFKAIVLHGASELVGNANLINAMIERGVDRGKVLKYVVDYCLELGVMSYYNQHMTPAFGMMAYENAPRNPDYMRLAYRCLVLCGDLDKAFALYRELELLANCGHARAKEIVALDQRARDASGCTPSVVKKAGKRVLFFQSGALGERAEILLLARYYKYLYPQDTVIFYDMTYLSDYYEKPDFIDEWYRASDFPHARWFFDHRAWEGLSPEEKFRPGVLLKDVDFDAIAFMMINSPRKLETDKGIIPLPTFANIPHAIRAGISHVSMPLLPAHQERVQALLKRINPKGKRLWGMQTRGETSYGTLQLPRAEYVAALTELAEACVKKYDCVLLVCGDDALNNVAYYESGDWVALDKAESCLYYKYAAMSETEVFFAATSGFSYTVYYQRSPEKMHPIQVYTKKEVYEENPAARETCVAGDASYEAFLLQEKHSTRMILDFVDQQLEKRTRLSKL